MVCPKCGTGIADDAHYCRSCGAATVARRAPLPGLAPGPMAGLPALVPAPARRPLLSAPLHPAAQFRTSRLAIAGLVFSIVFGVTGLILALMARREIRASQGRLTGNGMVIAAIVLSVINMALGLLFALA